MKKYLLLLFLAAFFLSVPVQVLPSIRYMQEGDEALLSERYQKAAAYYLKALNYSDPKQKHLLWDDLGYAYLRLGQTAKAERFLSRVIDFDPQHYDARLYLAAVYYLKGEKEAALLQLNEIKDTIYFDNSWTWKAETYVFYHPSGRHAEDSEWTPLSRERGVYLEETNHSGNARRAVIYIDALHESNEALLHYLRAVILFDRGKIRDAERTLQAARAAGYPLDQDLKKNQMQVQNPDQLSIHHRFRGHRTALLREKLIDFQEVLETGNLSQGVSVLHQALNLDAESFHANHNLALLHLDQAQLAENTPFLLEKAKRYCARALWFHDEQSIKREDLISCMDLMANIYFQQNNFETALQEYRKILEMDPANTTARYNLGCSYYNLRHFEEADTVWTQILEASEQPPEEQARVDENSPLHALTVRKAPIVYLTYKALGNLYFSQKKFAEAGDLLKKAVSIRPRTPDPYFNLALSLAEKKKWEEAAVYLEEYIYLGGPREMEARKKLDKWKNK